MGDLRRKADGEEAVERFRTLHPDVVVRDAVMPRRNGFDASREIVRNSPEIPASRHIFMRN